MAHPLPTLHNLSGIPLDLTQLDEPKHRSGRSESFGLTHPDRPGQVYTFKLPRRPSWVGGKLGWREVGFQPERPRGKVVDERTPLVEKVSGRSMEAVVVPFRIYAKTVRIYDPR
jgi:hypothetical protein